MLKVRLTFILIGLACLIVGLFYKKETHKEMDYTGGTTSTLDGSFGEASQGAFIEYLLNKLPWWVIKIFWICLGMGIIIFAFVIEP